MKTTLNLDDDVMRAARARAAAEGLTLTHLIEDAVRRRLTAETLQGEEYRLELPVVRGDAPATIDVASNATVAAFYAETQA